MAFTEDLTVFFDTLGFAEDAEINLPESVKRTVKIILNTPSQDIQIFETAVETDLPNVMIKTVDTDGVKTQRDTIKILSLNKSFKINRIAHDGTGVSTLYFK